MHGFLTPTLKLTADSYSQYLTPFVCGSQAVNVSQCRHRAGDYTRLDYCTNKTLVFITNNALTFGEFGTKSF